MAKQPKSTDATDGWIEWNGGRVPVDGTGAWGFIQFKHEDRAAAEARRLSCLEFWPWFGEDEQPCVMAYKIMQPGAGK